MQVGKWLSWVNDSRRQTITDGKRLPTPTAAVHIPDSPLIFRLGLCLRWTVQQNPLDLASKTAQSAVPRLELDWIDRLDSRLESVVVSKVPSRDKGGSADRIESNPGK